MANVSHELKTPVGAMALLAEAVLDAADDPTRSAASAPKSSTGHRTRTPRPPTVKNVATGFCLDSNANRQVYTLGCNGGSYQEWTGV